MKTVGSVESLWTISFKFKFNLFLFDPEGCCGPWDIEHRTGYSTTDYHVDI